MVPLGAHSGSSVEEQREGSQGQLHLQSQVGRFLRVIAFLSAFAATPAFADAYRLQPAAKLRDFSTYDSIAERRGDLVVFEPGGEWWAQHVTFVVIASYDELSEVIASIKRNLSIASVHETSVRLAFTRLRSFDGPEDPDVAAANREIAARERRLMDRGISLTDYRQAEVVSARFDADGSESFAQVVFLIVDLRQIFSRNCLLFVVTRVDQTREWARLAHTPVILPFRVTATTRLVTNSELILARSILESFGKRFAGPVLTGPPLQPLRSLKTLLELKEVADTACPAGSAFSR